MDVKSTNKRTPGVLFSKDHSDALAMNYKMKEGATMPGPGTYDRYSEFNPKYHKD